MDSKFAAVKKVGRGKTSKRKKEKYQNICYSSHQNDVNDWICGFVVSLGCLFSPLLIFALAGQDVAKYFWKIICSCNVILLCMSTVLSLLILDSWGTVRWIRCFFSIYLPFAVIAYAYTSYMECAGIPIESNVSMILNIIISGAMVSMIIGGYILR